MHTVMFSKIEKSYAYCYSTMPTPPIMIVLLKNKTTTKHNDVVQK